MVSPRIVTVLRTEMRVTSVHGVVHSSRPGVMLHPVSLLGSTGPQFSLRGISSVDAEACGGLGVEAHGQNGMRSCASLMRHSWAGCVTSPS